VIVQFQLAAVELSRSAPRDLEARQGRAPHNLKNGERRERPGLLNLAVGQMCDDSKVFLLSESFSFSTRIRHGVLVSGTPSQSASAAGPWPNAAAGAAATVAAAGGLPSSEPRRRFRARALHPTVAIKFIVLCSSILFSIEKNKFFGNEISAGNYGV
jgi:hypothetical protein